MTAQIGIEPSLSIHTEDSKQTSEKNEQKSDTKATTENSGAESKNSADESKTSKDQDQDEVGAMNPQTRLIYILDLWTENEAKMTDTRGE